MARLLPDLKQYFRPDSLWETYSLLAEHDSQARLYSGCTSLSFSRPRIETVIDLTRLPLHEFELLLDDSLQIGALATVREIETNPEVKKFGKGILLQACDKLASTPLRNLITIGGNIMGGFNWSDLPVALLVLEASIRYYDGSEKQKQLEIDGKHRRSKLLDSTAILTHIILPEKRRDTCAAFLKFARTQSDLALVTAAVSFHNENNTLRNVKVACGSLVVEPSLIPEVEFFLEGKEISETLFKEAGGIAAEVVKPRPDSRAGVEYRQQILATLIERSLVKALGGQQ